MTKSVEEVFKKEESKLKQKFRQIAVEKLDAFRKNAKILPKITGYVFYFYDMGFRNGIMLPFTKKIKPILRLADYNQILKLEDPAFYLEGKPVFLVSREYPISIMLDLLEETVTIPQDAFENSDLMKEWYEQNKDKFEDVKDGKKVQKARLVERGCSASELEARCYSVFGQLMHRKLSLDKKTITVGVLAVTIMGFVMYVIMSLYYGGIIKDLEKQVYEIAKVMVG